MSCIVLPSGDDDFMCCSPSENFVAERLEVYAARCASDERGLCELGPRDFAREVIASDAAIAGGDWVQPIYRKVDDEWQLCKLEVLYRLRDARGVPFPAFVNFVKAATDETPNPDPDLRGAFCAYAVTSLQRVDSWLSQLGPEKRASMASAGLKIAVNVTAKQLETALSAPLENHALLSLEETEYDDEPANLQDLRHRAWQAFGAFSLDDVKPTLPEVEAFAVNRPLSYSPPLTPAGKPYKPLATRYNHDLACARRFIGDFRRSREEGSEKAQGDLKLDEEFCCYLIGVGHAPFSRATMQAWREQHPEASSAIRALGLALIKEALDAGMGVCLEVSFQDADVQWLLDAAPELGGRLLKQGGRSGSVAVPHTVLENQILSPPTSPQLAGRGAASLNPVSQHR